MVINLRKLLVRGFEPLRSCERQPLKLVRLPFRHFRAQTAMKSVDRLG
jgi:hypothetical protein